MMNAVKLPLITALATLLVATVEAQVVTYENLSSGALAGYSELNANNPIFGDALDMTQGGTLSSVGISLFNSTSGGNTGSILTGTTLIKFYNNTVPYAGGALSSLPLLGSAVVSWDFTSDPLTAGFYDTSVFDISSLNISVPANIFITQQFTLTSGTSTRNGVILFNNPTVGSSPATVYISSAATAEGLYTFSGNPNQFGYYVEVGVVPEPSTLALAALGGLAVAFRRRSSK